MSKLPEFTPGNEVALANLERRHKEELTKLRRLVKQGEAVVEDFMPNIGKCVIQDFGRLNQFLIEAKKVQI